jgi:hypothetical protein
MSDRSDDDVEEDEDEGDESVEHESSEGSLQDKDKQESMREDIALIKDIMAYIDQTSRRVSDRLELEQRVQEAEQQQQQQQQQQQFPAQKRSVLNNWAYYEDEELCEADRAELLERALITLSQEQG